MIKCTKCGKELEDGSLFCDNCGTRVAAGETAEASQAEAKQEETKPAEAQQTETKPAEAQQTEAKPAEVQQTEAKPAEAQQTEAKPAEVQQAEAKQEETKPAEAQQTEAKQEETKPEQPANAFCPNCGSPVPEGTVFCQNCGVNVATGEMAGQPAQPAEPKQAEVQLAEPRQTEAQQATGQGRKKKSKGLLIGIIAAACVAVLAVAAAGLFFLSSGKSSGIDYTFYIKDKEVFYTGSGAKSSVQITDNLAQRDGIGNSDLASASSYLSYYFVKSDDGRLIFFPDRIDAGDNGINLYYKKLSQANKEAKKIDSDVTAYSVNHAATLVTYLKDEDSLYSYDLKKEDKEKISGDVSRYKVSEDGRKVYYLNDEDALYLWKQGKDKEKIDSDVTKVYYNTEDFKTIYYMKEDSFYKKTEGKDKEKIASNVSAVLQVYDSGAVYYLKDNSENQSMSDFVIDDKEEEDLNIKEPEWPSSPWRFNYSSEAAYNAAVAEYNKARDEYDEKAEQYQQKLVRDAMREALNSGESFDLESYELYYYDGRNEDKITGGFLGRYNYDTATDAEVIVYSALDVNAFEKVKLSKFESVYDLESKITKELTESASRYVAIKDKVSMIDTESGQGFTVNAKGDSILFMDDVDVDKSRGDLYVVKINNGKLSSPELYDTDVSTYNWNFMGSGHISYFKDYDSGSGDLYIDKKQGDYDVYRYTRKYDADGDRFYYFTDYNDSKEQGTLKVYKNGKSEKIADDVTDYCLVGGDVYYLGDYSKKSYKGDLYRYSNSNRKSKKIDDDVVGIVGAGSREGVYGYGW